MRKVLKWLVAISLFVLVISMGVMCVKIFSGDYDFMVEGYIVLISWIVYLVCIVALKFSNPKSKCRNCGKLMPIRCEYCPYCGKEL